MFQRTPLPASGPVVYHPGQAEPARQPEPAVRTLSLDELAAQQAGEESPSLLYRVNQRRGTIVTVMVTIAALSSFGGTVYWAHKQDIERGGPGLPIPTVRPADGPAKIKPDDPKGQQIPNQDIDAYRRVDPNAVPLQPERLMPPPATPRMPATAAPAPAAPEAAPPAATPPSTPPAATTPPPTVTATAPTLPPAQPAPAATPPAPPPTEASTTPEPAAAQPKISDTGGGPSIASIVDGLNGPAAGGGYRIQVASERSEDVAKATWARLQKANSDVLGNLRMQPARADLGDKGTWYRVQAGPLEEKQAKDTCARLKTRNVGCVLLPPR
ncbi:SPOR domain-containing protein [Vineibacter terrae]|uniref:SPOR domain-containing protein n=1 Tax=Vineibacter terrae TaxID=2586908 RepID=A0A5C8PIH2_9HYPH|nr:SPOR domain-containing protein [Vineibacter terrae]TXL73607.1 SPOR domain-containing protein [Vineibacter terrae]